MNCIGLHRRVAANKKRERKVGETAEEPKRRRQYFCINNGLWDEVNNERHEDALEDPQTPGRNEGETNEDDKKRKPGSDPSAN